MTVACRAPEHPLKRTLVVGGVASYVTTTLTQKLARWGFAVESHQEMRPKMAAHVSSGIDAVIVFAEMVPRRNIVDAWVAAAGSAGIPAIVLTRQESTWPKVMDRFGFRPLNPVTANAVATNEEEQPVMKTPSTTSAAAVTPITYVPKPTREATPFDGKLEEMEVLLAELREAGLTSLQWSAEKGLDYEAVVKVRGHRSI